MRSRRCCRSSPTAHNRGVVGSYYSGDPVSAVTNRLLVPTKSETIRERVFENRQVRASRLVVVVIMARWTMASWWSGLVS